MEASAWRRLAIRRGYVCPSCIARGRRTQQIARRKFHASPSRRNDVLQTLEERGLINQIAGNRDALSEILTKRKVSIYAGIDPTAPSLHLGHLLPLMVLFWLRNHGHNVVSLIGGATSQVGDPSGRLTSRQSMAAKEQTANVKKMWQQTERLWERAQAYGKRHGFETTGKAQMLDNNSWLKSLKLLTFLKMLGNGMRMGTMLGRDTVKNKMEKGDGMSFAEFTYPLLQGWDWWHMYSTHGVQVQVGGADQYGNIVAGMDAVRFIAQNEGQGVLETAEGPKDPMGLTVPLLTTSSGEKFGKSAGNAMWLSRNLTSSFDLYGFLLKTADADVERYLKLFTFVPIETIRVVMQEHTQAPHLRNAQRMLAGEVLELVHGEEQAEQTKAEHAGMRSPTLQSVTRGRKKMGRPPKSEHADPEADAEEIGPGEQHIILSKSKVLGQPFATILHNASLASSLSEGKRMIKGGGVYVAQRVDQEGSEELNFVPVNSLSEGGNIEELLIEKRLVLRLGKWKVRVLEVVDDSLFDCDLFRV